MEHLAQIEVKVVGRPRCIFLIWVALFAATPLARTQPGPNPILRQQRDDKSAPSAARIQTESALVLVPVTVVDRLNRFVNGLEKQDFRIFEDNQEQTILNVSKEDTPLSIGLLVDCSGSMGEKLQSSREAVDQFLKIANPEDEVSLIVFNETAELLQSFTHDWSVIRHQLASAKSTGRTALLDALGIGFHEMKNARNPRKVILVISDGGDNNSRHTRMEIRRAAREADVQIYAMGNYEPMETRWRTPEEQDGPDLVSEFAKDTGGREFEIHNATDLAEVPARIAMELRNQYVLAYSPQNQAHDGKYRRIRVDVFQQHGLASLRAFWRRGYFARPD